MDTILSVCNAAVCGVLALLLSGMVLSNRVNDGVVIKAGLIAMALGFGAIALCFADGSSVGDGQRLAPALLLVNIGIGVVIAGYLWRTYRAGHPLARRTDWTPLEESK